MRHRQKIGLFQLGTERGSAILAALLAIVVLLLVGATAVNLSHLERMIARRHIEYLQASYLAESGIERARAAILKDPRILASTTTTFQLEVSEPELAGKAVVTVTRPAVKQLLTVKSDAQLSGGAKKIWQATMTAPPDYELYCDKVQLNPALDIVKTLQAFGIIFDNPIPPFEGGLEVDQRCQGAYQGFAGDAEYFSAANHTNRYQAPGPIDIDFWRKAGESSTTDWGPYVYHFVNSNTVLSPILEGTIYAVDGDVLIYTAGGQLEVCNCLVIATGDIWIINLGDNPSLVTGLYLAGGNINLYQATNDMQIMANLCANRNVNICCGGKDNLIYLEHVENQAFVKGAPEAIRDKLGFLSIKSYQEVLM